MAKKPVKKRASEPFVESESDEYFAHIAGYTPGGTPYGITWEEQEEIERREAARNSVIPPAQKEPVSLNEMIQEMHSFSDTMEIYYQRTTGTFVVIADEYLSAAEDDEAFEDRPEWEQEIRRQTADFLARKDDGDYVPLPSRYDIHEYAIMENFCHSLENRKIAQILFRSLAGKKPFRRFKDALHSQGLEKQWYAFRDLAYKDIARKWCEEHRLSWREGDDETA